MFTKKQLIFLDIDGCLTTGKNNPIPWRYIKALQNSLKKYQNFYEYVIVTARPAPYAEATSQFLGLMDTKNNKYAICESGTVLHLFGSDTFFVAPQINIDVLNDFEKNLRWLKEIYHFNIEDGRKRTICILAEENNALSELSETLKEYLPAGIGMHVSAGGIDFIPNKIDKAQAVLSLTKKLNVDLNHAICIGDSGGDIPLMNIVGHPACPDNAGEKVKKLVKSKSGYTAENKHSLGVVEILEYYYNNKKPLIKKGIK